MNRSSRWSRVLVIVGLVAMLVGAIDPIEGSLVILPGIGMVAIGATLAKSRYRKLLVWSFVLVLVGVAALFGLSAIGGFGVTTGRSNWWAIVLLPYPVGGSWALWGLF